MTKEEAIKILNVIIYIIPKEYCNEETEGAIEMAIKSLEAWEIIKDNLSQQVHHNLDVKENFETGSTSRIECNTTASVLAGVIYLIDRHLSEVEHESARS